MLRRKHTKPGEGFPFTLSIAERDLIVERAFIDPKMDARLRNAQASGAKLMISLTFDEVDDLLGCIAAEANHSKNSRIERSLDAVYDRLAKVQDGYTDEEPASPAVVPAKFTAKQGQYLAFIYYYSKIHRMPPAEADLQQYFGVSPPVVHQMILALETHGLIERSPGKARSIRLRISRSELPDLE